VLFNACLGLSEDLFVSWLRLFSLIAPGGMTQQQSSGAESRFEECASIHRDSKQQWHPLLKPKIV
jgi:hypothetical protein